MALIDELTPPRILKITGIGFSSRLSPEDTLPQVASVSIIGGGSQNVSSTIQKKREKEATRR